MINKKKIVSPKFYKHISFLSRFGVLVLLTLLNFSCKSALMHSSKKIILADKEASRMSKYLMARLKSIPKTGGYAFGQQDATSYGVTWRNDGTLLNKSDIYDITGDLPAVYGFEIGHIELDAAHNLDTVNFNLMKSLIKEAHNKGGVITISWHPDNLFTSKTAWDPTPVVPKILEGGELHQKYRSWLSKVANFLNSLEYKKNKKIPIVFRPFHEMNEFWFWWGNKSCTPEEFKKLWQQTFTILTETYGVHNVLFCYSPEIVEDKEEYLKYYPGDEYVDILGIDLYQKDTPKEYETLLQDNLGILAQLATAKNMPYALSEGGLEKVAIPNWWTNILDKNIINSGISWMLVWRNSTISHHYVPYNREHISAEDFKKFEALKHVYFLKDISEIK